MKSTDQITVSRREFSQLMLMFLTMFSAGSTAKSGIDVASPKSKARKGMVSLATPSDCDGVSLAIDFPSGDGWRIISRLSNEDWLDIAIDPDDVSPAIHRQLLAAQSAEYGTPVLARVLGDTVAILDKARYFAPGESDDREEGDFSMWRIEWFGDGIRRIAPDNTSWWPKRLAVEPEFLNRERAFMDVWLQENDVHRWGGEGLAQTLMLSTHRYERPANFEPWLTNRERKILSTFVQWLGTNCGQGFLHQVRSAGGLSGV